MLVFVLGLFVRFFGLVCGVYFLVLFVCLVCFLVFFGGEGHGAFWGLFVHFSGF